MSIIVSWQDNVTFSVVSENGHELTIDADSKKAPCPTEILLSALGSCSATDVVLFYQENQYRLDCLTNVVTYELTDDEPRLYKSVNLHFKIKGADVDSKLIDAAISAAISKYCHVCLMLQPAINISYTTEFTK